MSKLELIYKNVKNDLVRKLQKIEANIYYEREKVFFDILKMDIQQQNNLSEIRKATEIEEQSPIHRQDLFEQLFIQQYQNGELIPEEAIVEPIRNRSKKQHLKLNDFRKILNSSSSNQRLIPSEMKYESSRENSQRDRHPMDTENSFDSESFRKSFKKRVDESFSVQNTIRDSSSSFSQRSERSYASFLPSSVYKQEDDMISEKKLGCNCKRSKCLKLYCECFQKKIFCNEQCHCYDCGNHKENITQHKQAIIEALARNAHGFDAIDHPQEKKENPEQKTLTFSLGFELQEVKKGCKCRKTHCVKNYCECYQNKTPCGVFCKCEDCHNTSSPRQHHRQNNHFMTCNSSRQNYQMKKYV